MISQGYTCPGAANHSQIQLAFATNVVNVHLECKRRGNTSANEHSGESKRVGDAARRSEAVAEHVCIGINWRVSGSEQEYCAEKQSRED
jgi:hypothetical protein